eukprot:6181073-Pleurochrysis_carterae.AAC.3
MNFVSRTNCTPPRDHWKTHRKSTFLNTCTTASNSIISHWPSIAYCFEPVPGRGATSSPRAMCVSKNSVITDCSTLDGSSFAVKRILVAQIRAKGGVALAASSERLYS